jgi:uncharacterized protein (TIGR03435 family)
VRWYQELERAKHGVNFTFAHSGGAGRTHKLVGRLLHTRYWSARSHISVRIVTAFLAMAIAWSAMGQEKRPTFEVASVKPSAGAEFPDARPRRSGSRVAMHSIRVATVVIYAYRLAGGALTTSYQLAGNLQMPDGWEEYDIDAIAPGLPGDDDLRLMFQVLLEERFKLKYHWEVRELPLYDLTVAKNGPRLRAGDPNRKGIAQRRPAEPEPGVSRLAGSGSIEDLAGALSARLESPVRNLTELAGGWYDFDVPFARDITVTTAAPNLVTAVEEELGLKLKRSKGPVQVLVVERVERPTEN